MPPKSLIPSNAGRGAEDWESFSSLTDIVYQEGDLNNLFPSAGSEYYWMQGATVGYPVDQTGYQTILTGPDYQERDLNKFYPPEESKYHWMQGATGGHSVEQTSYQTDDISHEQLNMVPYPYRQEIISATTEPLTVEPFSAWTAGSNGQFAGKVAIPRYSRQETGRPPKGQQGNACSSGNPLAEKSPSNHKKPCQYCQRRKIRCDGQLPCYQCRRKGISCLAQVQSTNKRARPVLACDQCRGRKAKCTQQQGPTCELCAKAGLSCTWTYRDRQIEALESV
jgi:hypothetical protein